MKFFNHPAYLMIFIFILFSRAADACESKGEPGKNATFPLKKDQCHEFTLATKSADFFLIGAQQKGVDVELRLFENRREIKSTDSENLNSGFEFLPFTTAGGAALYTLQVRWVDDRQSMIKNDGFYTLNVERRALADEDITFVERFDKAKSFYDKATAARIGGEPARAVSDYLSAVELYQSLPSSKPVSYKLQLAHYYLGVSYNLLKKNAEAVAVFEKIRPAVGESEDKYLKNLLFKELGIAYFRSGNYRKSEEMLDEAANGFEQSVAESIGEKAALFSTYINQAETFLKIGKTEPAITLLENVRANIKDAAPENLLASLKLADVYLDLGDQRKAEELIDAVKLPENASDYLKGVFNKISGKLYIKTDREKAIAFFTKSKTFFNGDEEETAQLLVFFGNAHYFSKDYKSAKLFYEQAKSSFERPNNSSELAQALNNLSVIYYTQKEYAAAIASCESSLSINTEMQDDLNRARNLINLMYFYEANGNDSSAVFYGKWAINTVQSIKYLQLKNLEKEVQENFRDSFTDAFRKLADLLIKAGRISEAEQVMRFIKEKEYQDYMRGENGLKAVDYTQAEERLLKAFEDKTAEKKPESTANKPERDNEQEVSLTQKLIEKLKRERIDVSEILFVTTLVAENSVSLVATNDRNRKVYTQSVPRAKLSAMVFEFREAVTDPTKNPRLQGKNLYDILVKPLESEMLSPQIRKIVWSLDGVLRYVPIPALFDGKNYLVRRFANIQLTLAGETETLLSKIDETPAIGFASSKPFENLSSLPIAKNELDCIFEDEKRLIINSTCTKGIIRGKKVADEEFTRDAFEDALKNYKLIHITSHFVLQTGDNSKSFLLLGGGSNRKYTMQEFSKQRLDNTEILIMSACNTANFSSIGAEFESFATMAQKRGTKAVIGTLWSVADNSTANFMTEFYRLFELERFDKAEAMRRAQLNVSRDKKYAHPFYWSPFVLFGNWR